MSEDFSRMNTGSSTRSSSSSSLSTPRNSISSNGKPSFERHSSIRNSLRKGQAPTPPKQVQPPTIPTKQTVNNSLPAPTPTQPETMPPETESQFNGHYGHACVQHSATASSLSIAPPTSKKPNFLSELNNIYAKKGITPGQLGNSSESDSDVDELPPPPPELLAEGEYENPYDVPSSLGGYSNGVPAAPLQYNPYSDRTTLYGQPNNYNSVHASSPPVHTSPARSAEQYSMSRVFASQTGTIKRAPPPPPKRTDKSGLTHH